MSGFERILARVGGDALSDYCSSAIEDELFHLKTHIQSCMTAVEKALVVQEAVAKLDVPLSSENTDVCANVKRTFEQFSADLGQFIKEQKKIQAESAKAGIKPPVGKRDNASAKADNKATPTQADRVTKLLGKIQTRITKKRNAWIDKNFADVAAIAEIIVAEDFPGPNKALRHELVLVLDHLISAVLLSSLTTQSTVKELKGVLKKLSGVHKDIDEYIESSNELLTRKRSSYAPSSEAVSENSVNIMDAQVFGVGTSEPQIKRQRVEEPSASSSDFLVKMERTAAANESAMEAADTTGSDPNTVYEVYVTDLPWGTTKDADVSSYFGIAGTVASVRMPTMDDGSTVGVAIVRFASFEGMTLALRMDGYPFNGKNIHVSVHKSS